jgi:hypothetical protein
MKKLSTLCAILLCNQSYAGDEEHHQADQQIIEATIPASLPLPNECLLNLRLSAEEGDQEAINELKKIDDLINHSSAQIKIWGGENIGALLNQYLDQIDPDASV